MYHGLKAYQIEGTDRVILEGPDILTGETYSVEVKRVDFDRYNAGALVQNRFPYLSADDREFLISGCGPGSFDKIFNTSQRD